MYLLVNHFHYSTTDIYLHVKNIFLPLHEIPNHHFITSVTICSMMPRKIFNYIISSKLLTQQRHNKEYNIRHNIKAKAINDGIYALRGSLALAVTV